MMKYVIRGFAELSEAPRKMQVGFVEILAHLPLLMQTDQARRSLRRYALEIPIGSSARVCGVKCSAVTPG